MALGTVGVVGCGLMGSGIAEISAGAGLKTIVREVTADLLAKGKSRIEKSLQRAVEKGKATAEVAQATLSRISFTTELDALAPCDLVVEAIVENIAEKKKLFAHLDGVCGPAAVFSSNTSSIPIGDMAAGTKRPQSFVGLHFFNPVPVMKLVEVVRTLSTSDAAYEVACDFAKRTGKTVVTAKDTPGFVVNLLLVPYLLDAVRAYEKGIATKEDIDTGMKLGCGHPMGPLELLDFVGNDTTLFIADIMSHEFKDIRYAAPPLLRRMVAAGHNGRKSGRGFYDYSQKK
ncbi:MAG TPA: 3-hydroxybutyryl-CoA dehydrogenase [Planctomycetota bacterium]|jgi:3-hydroxybutyryl-CoA dehydrogenase|nr:3-hydroxybutyryl-CoA dehydrogenase [Planctomycetota bacterium]